ncbi:DUF1501 domain-containing protein [Vandammella animalimorsus]|uniref:DUF1501 domain-containing protein n=1 Tax=Vandammella animalimorsus TaxID=2029117 RepID=A0A3M6RJ61_9BURK|nr:DUF1501 domain-containing protein [Vandammella animalimorsus]RMX14898.1 DUF1501 domain-containing protein [Vandammella animalimorsus]
MDDFNTTSRRAFLRRFGQLGLAGAAAPWAMNLAAISEAAAFNAGGDYKALVCVFLYGGNDNGNTLIRVDDAGYASYAQMRMEFATPRASLAATTLAASAGQPSGQRFALAPQLSGLKKLYDQGALAIQQNVGPLIVPTTLEQYRRRSVPLPPKLFSHNDQQSVWQSSHAEGSVKGWGGAIGDLALSSGATDSTFACISAAGQAVFISGQSALTYRISTQGAARVRDFNNQTGGCARTQQCVDVLRELVTEARPHMLEEELNRMMRRSMAASDKVDAMLAIGTEDKVSDIPDTNLGKQLAIVARLIAGNRAIGVRRQVFFVSMTGFDDHALLATRHPEKLTELNDALVGFYESMRKLNMADQVTAFTASEFGRCMVTNGNGSDHGWGSTHMVLGGAVKGGIYGKTPIYHVDADFDPSTGLDVGQGRMIPTASVDEYAATLARWFGVSDSEMRLIVPNIGNFASSNLGFLG